MASLHERILHRTLEAAGSRHDALAGRSILVTGATGFLASNLLVFLHHLSLRQGLGLRLLASARRSPEAQPLFRWMATPPPAWWQIASVEQTELPGPGDLIVVHAGSYGSPRDYQREPLATFRANTEGLIHLIRQSQETRARQVVYFSSAEIYGQAAPADIPTRETCPGSLATLEARSIYGESKRMAEVLGSALLSAGGPVFTVLRPWNVYGPGQRWEDGRVPLDFLRQARQERSLRLLSDGTPSRSFCYVWDAVAQIAALLGGEAGAWNIGHGGAEMTILDLAREVAAVCGLPPGAVLRDPDARAPGLRRSVPEVTKIQTLLGGQVMTPLREGLEATREWVEFLQPS